MKKSIIQIFGQYLLLALVAIFSFLPTINAQDDINVEVTNILYDYTIPGFPLLVEFGEIVLSFNSEILPIDLTITDPASCGGNIEFINNLASTWTISGISCPGEYCFIAIKDEGTLQECTIRFCVEIKSCGRYFRTNGDLGWEEILCKEQAVLPSDNLVINNSDVIETTKQKETEINGENSEIVLEEKIDLTKVYPNPFKNELNLEINTMVNADVQVILFNSFSKVILEKNYNLEQGDNSISLEFENDLPSGMYILIVKSTNEKYFTKKLIHIQD